MRQTEQQGTPGEVFLAFLRLGCTSFGGPVAHLGYFRDEFIVRRAWLSDETYTELIALAQSLPGPSSSQVGYAIGIQRAGLLGGLAAWAGFTLPSAALMFTFALGHNLFAGTVGAALLHGLQLVAVAVVAQAVLQMRKTLAPDAPRLLLALAAAAVVLFVPAATATLFAIVLAGILGALLLRGRIQLPATTPGTGVSRRAGTTALTIFLALAAISFAAQGSTPTMANIFAGFFRSGTLVFGGGHVVLPILNQWIATTGWVPRPLFLGGYGAAQALPGPLFSFATYVGALIRPAAHPAANALLATCAIFAPGMLLITVALPMWRTLRSRPFMAGSLAGINSSVLGVLAAALIRPVGTEAIHSIWDIVIAAAAFACLTFVRIAPWVVVTTVAALLAAHAAFVR